MKNLLTNTIHPRSKKDAGERLGLTALAKTYSQPVSYSGPVFDSMKPAGDKIRLSFKFADQDLATRPANSPVDGFAICGEDHKWIWANASIDGATVVVSAPSVPKPLAVRYAWADNPACNLYN